MGTMGIAQIAGSILGKRDEFFSREGEAPFRAPNWPVVTIAS